MGTGSGRVEHGLGDVFLTTLMEARETARRHQKARTWPVARPNELSDELLRPQREWRPETAADASRRIHLQRTPGTAAILSGPLRARPRRFLVWLLTYGRKEHHLSPSHLAPLKAQWRAVLAGLPDWRTRVRYEFIRRGMGASVQVRDLWRRLPVWRARLKPALARQGRQRPPSAETPLPRVWR